MATEIFRSAPEPEKQLAHYFLLDALLARRSRRFGKGMRLNGGPLAYASMHEPDRSKQPPGILDFFQRLRSLSLDIKKPSVLAMANIAKALGISHEDLL